MDDDTKAVLTAPYGSEVEYRTKRENGIGKLNLVWYGVAEVIDIRRYDGSILHLYPSLGETAKLISKGIDDPTSNPLDD